MAAAQSERQPRKFLRVTKQKQLSAGERVHNALDNMGLHGLPHLVSTEPLQQAVIPRGRGIVRGGIRRSERKPIARAIAEMGFASEGTALWPKKWNIERVRVDRKGREHVMTLHEWPFGWGAKIRKEHNKQVASARRVMPRVIQTDLVSSLQLRNPVRNALVREQVEHRKIVRADRKEGIGPLARLVAKFLEPQPLGISRLSFRVGDSRRSIYDQIHTTMLQMADEHLDPANRIHGPFDRVVKRLERFQKGPLGNLLTSSASDVPFVGAAIEKLFDLTSPMITINKALSRDARGEVSVRAGLRILRRIKGIEAYGDAYQRWGFLRKLIMPEQSFVEDAVDRRMNRGNVAKFAKAEAIIRVDPRTLRNPLQVQHQRVVAEEFIRAYNAPAPILEQLINKGIDNVENKVGNVQKQAAQFGERVASAVESKLPSALRRKAVVATEKPVDILKTAEEAYGGQPMSIRQQVDAILAHADEVLALPNLDKKARVLWQRSKEYAKRFNNLFNAAHAVTILYPQQ